jgi:hypothetical protein
VPPEPRRGGFWPTAEQEELLRAAVLHGPAALDAWARWRDAVDLDRLDPGSLRLLPELYRNLLHEGVTGPALGRLKGIYRQTWYRNQLVFRDMARILPDLHAAGIPTLVVKGAALILRYHGDHGARPMDDFDIVVPADRAARALDLLQRRGWRTAAPLSPYRLRAFNGIGLRDQGGRDLDLHWHLLAEDCRPDADREFWAAAEPVDLQGARVLVLNPADELLHALVHGLRWNEIPPIRWIADAVHIIELSDPGLDWNRLVTAAARHRVTLPVLRGLAYLRALVEAPVPAEIIERLARVRISLRERLEHRVALHPRSRLLGSLPEYWIYWMRATDGAGPAGRLRGFSSYLRDEWQCESGRELWTQILLRMARRLRGERSASSR